ncbi:MAG: nucleotidyltransferase family protein [Deltaproteobacteria bacterium]|nr:MAG: nucleotidyltransferase family protein [Deltaproteobacteria bacterium]
MHPFLKPGDRLVVKRLSPESYRLGDVVVLHNSEDIYRVHRLIKLLPRYRGITKGDSLLAPDHAPVTLSSLAGRVEMVARGRRLIPIAYGPRSYLSRLYAVSSRLGLTSGALKQRIKNALAEYLRPDDQNESIPLKQVLISIRKGRFPQLTANINWRSLREAMRQEGLAGIVYPYLKDEDVPASELEKIQNSYHSLAAQNIIHLHALKHLEDVMGPEKIEIMTLKGASLLSQIYPSVGLRPMEDLDLMVRPDDRERFVQLLKHSGYQQNSKRSNSFTKGDVVIDLHTHALNTDRIQSREDLFPGGMDPIWESSIPWGADSRWVRRPGDVDNILLLSQHFLKHYYSRLIWLEDIYRLVRNRDQKFWRKLLNRADQLQQTKPLSYTLYLLKAYYNFETPPGSGTEKPAEKISTIERTFLRMTAQDRPFVLLAQIMAFFCIRGFGKRIRFGLENLFPRKEIIKSEFGTVIGRNRALFYPARLFKTVVLVLRCLFLPMGGFIREFCKRFF